MIRFAFCKSPEEIARAGELMKDLIQKHQLE
jgi:hypothetical protein